LARVYSWVVRHNVFYKVVNLLRRNPKANLGIC